jgi:hypothetical protein
VAALVDEPLLRLQPSRSMKKKKMRRALSGAGGTRTKTHGALGFAPLLLLLDSSVPKRFLILLHARSRMKQNYRQFLKQLIGL